MRHTRKLERHGRENKDDKDETTILRILALEPSAIDDTKSLEESAELAEGTLKPAAPEAATMDRHDLSKK